MGLSEIARNLNDRGIPCPTAFLHGKGEAVTRKGDFGMMCWTGGVVLSVLQNEVYTGAVVSLKSMVDSRKGKQVARPREEWVRVEGMHEAVVTGEEFRRVQELVSPQRPAAGKRRMRYVCGVCGKRLTRRNGADLYCNRGYMVENCECRQV
ncbi:MAG: recombinase family protein, partial [Muribaculaceae bacterium]|nr:recombinase family protein [Muribaculaceae bacterium]